MQYVLPKTFQARCNMVRKSERKSANLHQGGVIQTSISGKRAAKTDGAADQDPARTFNGLASLDPAREHDIHLASFDFVLGPGEAHEVSPQKYSCVASVDARLQAWFLPMSSLVSAYLRVQDRRLHKDIVVDSLVQSTEIFQFRVQWRPPYNPTDVQIVKLKASVGEALREMTDVLRNCQRTTPSQPLGPPRSLALKIQRYIATNGLKFEATMSLGLADEPRDAPVSLTPRLALPCMSKSQGTDKPIIMKVGHVHVLAGRVSSVMPDGTPFEGTFSANTNGIDRELPLVVGHWVQIQGDAEFEEVPLSAAARLTGSATSITAVDKSWRELRLEPLRQAIERLAGLPTIDPPERNDYAGTLFDSEHQERTG